MKTQHATVTTEPRSPLRSLDDKISGACDRISPTWPLDRFIAVNPFWGMTQKSLSEVAADLAAASGSRLLMPRSWYREAHEGGRFGDEHVLRAIEQSGAKTTLAEVRALLECDATQPPKRARLADVLDATRDLEHVVSWRDFVTNSVSQFCAAYFDDGQASFAPDREGGLYASWRRQALGDKAPALLMGLRGYAEAARSLPPTSREMASRAISELGVPEAELETYLWSLLLDQNGWASWCAYRRWMARLGGSDDDTIVDLLAIRLAWEWLLYRTGDGGVAGRWRLAMASWPRMEVAAKESQADDWILQRAMEIAWQDTMIAELSTGLDHERKEASLQAVFCIDVRSEVFRRALEFGNPDVQTLGFAGFFGLPIEYRAVGAVEARPQLPGLLAPRFVVTDTGLEASVEPERRQRLDLANRWRQLKTGAVSTFAFVEAMGLAYAGELVAESLGKRRPAGEPALSRDVVARRKPRLTASVGGEALSVEARRDLAAGMLRAMSLTHDFARVVLLAGHGSETRNNPHAAGLDCGACCGQTGEVNARAAVALLNDAEVREGLASLGILVPESTRFIAGLHNTTTDDLTLFDLDELPATHERDVAELRTRLVDAGARARAERAGRLGIKTTKPSELDDAVRTRARDWAQVRAEWGLANNAAFIVAPRERCVESNLEGRAFLHEYRFEEDAGFAVLELIMTAPMVVAHWINLQYYASTVDNARYGSGNKVLHNVVGGHLGVFEGNGGDLRIGLPMQSLHDGERWVHTPLRLSVVIEAPRSAIEAVLEKHDKVRGLVDQGWLDLFALDAGERAVYAYRGGRWVERRAGA